MGNHAQGGCRTGPGIGTLSGWNWPTSKDCDTLSYESEKTPCDHLAQGRGWPPVYRRRASSWVHEHTFSAQDVDVCLHSHQKQPIVASCICRLLREHAKAVEANKHTTTQHPARASQPRSLKASPIPERVTCRHLSKTHRPDRFGIFQCRVRFTAKNYIHSLSSHVLLFHIPEIDTAMYKNSQDRLKLKTTQDKVDKVGTFLSHTSFRHGCWNTPRFPAVSGRQTDSIYMFFFFPSQYSIFSAAPHASRPFIPSLQYMMDTRNETSTQKACAVHGVFAPSFLVSSLCRFGVETKHLVDAAGKHHRQTAFVLRSLDLLLPAQPTEIDP